MGLLDGAIAAAFADAFSSFYLDATLHRWSTTGDGKGGGSSSFVPEAVKAQRDVATDAMRRSDGYVDTDVRILVLASCVAKPSTDDEITLLGQRYSIANVDCDPAGSYWDLHGRLASTPAADS